jgi:hypothetical protein
VWLTAAASRGDTVALACRTAPPLRWTVATTLTLAAGRTAAACSFAPTASSSLAGRGVAYASRGVSATAPSSPSSSKPAKDGAPCW